MGSDDVLTLCHVCGAVRPWPPSFGPLGSVMCVQILAEPQSQVVLCKQPMTVSSTT